MQFCFTSDHSTLSCYLTMEEVIKYYQNRGSVVNAVIVDASKAFDKVHHDKLFQLFTNRNIPTIALRQIADIK